MSTSWLVVSSKKSNFFFKYSLLKDMFFIAIDSSRSGDDFTTIIRILIK